MERVAPSSHMHRRDQLRATLHFAISLHFDIVCSPRGRTTGGERKASRCCRSNVAKEWEGARSEQTIRQHCWGTAGNEDVPLRWADGTRCSMWEWRGPEDEGRDGKRSKWSVLTLIFFAVIVYQDVTWFWFFSQPPSSRLSGYPSHWVITVTTVWTLRGIFPVSARERHPTNTPLGFKDFCMI